MKGGKRRNHSKQNKQLTGKQFHAGEPTRPFPPLKGSAGEAARARIFELRNSRSSLKRVRGSSSRKPPPAPVSHQPRPLGPPRPARLLTGFASHITVAKSSGESLGEGACRGPGVGFFPRVPGTEGMERQPSSRPSFSPSVSQASVFGPPNLPTSARSADPAPPPGSRPAPIAPFRARQAGGNARSWGVSGL